MTRCKHCGNPIYKANYAVWGEQWTHDSNQFGGDRFCPPVTAAEPEDGEDNE